MGGAGFSYTPTAGNASTTPITVGYGTFANVKDPTGNNVLGNMVLPYAGWRYIDGVLQSYGTQGGYVSSTAINSTEYRSLGLMSDGTLVTTAHGAFGHGIAIRCVPLQSGEHLPAENVPSSAMATGAEILYFTENGTLQIGHWDTPNNTAVGALGAPLTNLSQLAYFKFGSVIGMTLGTKAGWDAAGGANNAYAWSPDRIKFSPRATYYDSPAGTTKQAISLYGNSQTANQSVAPFVPCYDADNTDDVAIIPAVDGTNLTDAYHEAKLTWGRGDPCRLAGLSTETARSMTDAQLQAYDSGWRVATNDQNIAFVGTATNNYSGPLYSPSTAATTPAGSWANGSYTASGLGLAGFPHSNNVQLPASGYLYFSTGAVYNPGSYGYFWSSTVYSATYGRDLFVGSSGVNPQYLNLVSYAFAVRCAPRN